MARGLEAPALRHVRPRDQQADLQYCGDWQQQYRAHHAAIIASQMPPRYAVAVHHAGLADSLIKAVWVFYYALLTNRAFLLGFPPSQEAKFEWAYDAPNINWTDGQHVLETVDYEKPSGPQDSGVFLYNDLDNWNETDEDARMFVEGDIGTMAESAETVVFWKGSGKTLALFDNPHHKKKLHSMGLRPEVAVGCALHFLFEPNAAVKRLFHSEFQLLAQPQVLKIGVQIRTSSYSDAAFFEKDKASSELDPSFWDSWFECAQQIEHSSHVSSQDVLWYMISDSQPLRDYAKRQFGQKLLVTMPGEGMTLDHSTWGSHGYQGFISAAGESWLFGMTDYQVVTAASNFGKLGALRSMRWHNLYILGVNADSNSVSRLGIMQSQQCNKNNYDRFEDVSATWYAI